MKKQIYISLLFVLPMTGFSQDRIFSLGYGKTFVANDSTTLSITLDLNRIPGQTEKAGGYYFINDVIGTKGWGYYLKPTMDINIGSSISSSPNNISVGLPVGLTYDFKETKIGIFSFYFDSSPELVADKSLKNSLYYFSVNTYFKYELNHKNILINLLTGVSNANGIRDQYELRTDKYGRITVPVYFKMTCWNAIAHKGKPNAKPFRRISWVNSLKFNSVYFDDCNINKETNYTFFSSKFDFYFTPNLGLNVTYFNGNEEPIFKQNNSITFGLTLAR